MTTHTPDSPTTARMLPRRPSRTLRHRAAGLLAALTLIGLPLTLATSPTVHAGMDLVTVPDRDGVQVTIYNDADLTLVRERRPLTLKEGENRLQFSWADTLIDPTSLDLVPVTNGDSITVHELTYPPRTNMLGRWTVESPKAGPNPFEITYFTSGIAWRAFYMGTLAADEKTMRLEGYVIVSNNSGEDYAEAETRLVVGKVQLLDEIAMLARRQPAYGRPDGGVERQRYSDARSKMAAPSAAAMPRTVAAKEERKQIIKEGLSEYFLYTIEGRETIENGWSKRLPSFDTADIPVVNLYKYDNSRFGENVVRFLSYKNDTAHKLGETPIPGGALTVYRQVDAAQHVSYEGQSSFKYIPVDEDVELNLGAVSNVIVEPKLMRTATDAFAFDQWGDIAGWDVIQEWQVEARNTRDVPVTVQVSRQANHSYWDQVHAGDAGNYEKIDIGSFRFTLDLPPRSAKTFTYTITHHEGTNRK